MSAIERQVATLFPLQKSLAPGAVAVLGVDSPVGPLLLACTARGLCWLEFVAVDTLAASKQRLEDQHGPAGRLPKHPLLVQAQSELQEYFAGRRTTFNVPLDPAGTDFQRTVWQSLCRIPFGKTWSYEDLAIDARRTPNACRAVGQANGRNPIAIIVPCHRVISKDGGLGGYSGELWRKEKLLELEGVRCG